MCRLVLCSHSLYNIYVENIHVPPINLVNLHKWFCNMLEWNTLVEECGCRYVSHAFWCVLTISVEINCCTYQQNIWLQKVWTWEAPRWPQWFFMRLHDMQTHSVLLFRRGIHHLLAKSVKCIPSFQFVESPTKQDWHYLRSSTSVSSYGHQLIPSQLCQHPEDHGISSVIFSNVSWWTDINWISWQ